MNPEDLRTIGVIVAVHGLQGAFKVESLSDFPERFDALKRVFLVRGGAVLGEYHVRRLRWAAAHLLIAFKEVTRREFAEEMIGAEICVPDSESWELPEDVFYTSDLLGFEGIGDDGTRLGVLTNVFESAQDILEFDRTGSTLLVPFVSRWVGKVDSAARTIEILNWKELVQAEEVPGEPETDDH